MVGKVLSQKNADALKAAFLTIGQILSAAGIVDLPAIEKLESIFEPEEEGEESAIAAAANQSSFFEDTKRLMWSENFNSINAMFVDRMMGIYGSSCCDDEVWERINNISKQDAAKSLLTQYHELLMDCVNNPPYRRAVNHIYAATKTILPEQNRENETTRILNVLPTTQVSNIENADHQEGEIVELSINASWVEEEEINLEAAAGDDNKYPVKGILFKIDQPSEGIPAVGPRLPLYVPMEVALSVVDTANGLPLDADVSLSKHSNQDIAGVIQSAEIRGKDFIIHGHLWPFNRPEKVQVIAQNMRENRLGMSMNANASGKKAVIDGREVFKIEKMILLGANILYADKATYQQSQLGSSVQIAASLDEQETDSNEKDSQMESLLIAQIQAMAQTLDRIEDQQTTDVASLQQQVSELKLVIATFQNEKASQQQAIQAQIEERSKAKEREELIDAIIARLPQSDPRNRTTFGQPPRLTTPIAAGGSGAVAEAPTQLQVKLIQAEAALQTLRESNGDRTKRFALAEEIKQIKAELAMNGQARY